MKTALKIISFIVLIMIGMTSVTKAQNTQMCFYVNITDSCSGTWSGGYCIHCYVVGGSNNYCLYSHCYSTWTTGPNLCTYPCTIDPIVSDKSYYIYVTVCRNQTPPTCCGSFQGFGPLYYTDLTSCSETIPVTLK